MSSTNVLSFFSLENRTHSRLSHSPPSSAKTGEVNRSKWVNSYRHTYIRLKICLLWRHLLKMVSHPSSFSATIEQTKIGNTWIICQRNDDQSPFSPCDTKSFFDFATCNLVHFVNIESSFLCETRIYSSKCLLRFSQSHERSLFGDNYRFL